MNFAVECTSDHSHSPNYTFRSMPRSQSAPPTSPKMAGVGEVRPARRVSSATRRLGKRVVQKADGRYLIYYEKV
jgi:hypothetical protein